MEKQYDLDKDDLTKRIDDINSKTGPFVRSVNSAVRALHPDNEEIDYPNAVRTLSDAVELEESAKNETLAEVNSMLEEMSTLHMKIEEDLRRYQKLSTEWYTIKHDLDVIDTIQLRLNASRDILTGNISKVEILKEDLNYMKEYIANERPLDEGTHEILYLVTDPSGKRVEHSYRLTRVE